MAESLQMFDCPTIEQLERYVAALPTSRDVAEHVALCQACGEHVDGIREDNLLLGEYLAADAGQIPTHADEPGMARSVP